MSKMKAAFFINPLSHTVSERGSVLEASAKDADILRFNIDQFSDVSTQVEETANARTDTIFVEGGDGTIHGVLTEVLSQKEKFDSLPNVVLLSGGMTNLIASNIGIRKPTPKKIDRIIHTPEAAKSNHVPLLRLKADTSGKEYFGFLLSSGALPAATIYCLDKIHTKGIGGSAAVRTTLLKVLLGRGAERDRILAPTPLTLDTNKTHLEGAHLTSVATTLPKLMIGINPFWGTEDAPVHLTYAGPEVKNKVRNIARMFKSSQSEKAQAALRAGGFQSWNVDTAKLVHDGPFVLDGEILSDTSGPLTLSASEPVSFLS